MREAIGSKIGGAGNLLSKDVNEDKNSESSDGDEKGDGDNGEGENDAKIAEMLLLS